MIPERRFYIDGRRQMVIELDGTVHEADRRDPDLLALQEKFQAWAEADANEPIAVLKRLYDAEWAIRIHEDDPVATPEHNARVDEWRAANDAARRLLQEEGLVDD